MVTGVRQGDIYYRDFGSTIGSQTAKKRPVGLVNYLCSLPGDGATGSDTHCLIGLSLTVDAPHVEHRY